MLVMQMNTTLKSSSLPVGIVRGCTSCESCQKVVFIFVTKVLMSFITVRLTEISCGGGIQTQVLARWRPEAGCRPGLEDAPVFFPLEEVNELPTFVL